MFKLFASLILAVLFSTHNLQSSHVFQNEISIALKNKYPNIQINFDSPLKENQDEVTSQEKDGEDVSLKMKYKLSEEIPNKNNKKASAYNTKSDKTITQVSTIAIQKSPTLISCSEAPEGCTGTEPSPSPTSTPTLTSTPTPVPIPIKPEPIPTPICKYEREMPCKMTACAELEVYDLKSICGCPCVPPPIY